MTTNERIVEVIKWQMASPSSFAKKIGFNQSNLSKIINGKREVPKNLIDGILKIFPEVNEVWLRTGEGSMLKEVEKSEIELHGSNTGIIQHRSKLKVGGNLTTGTTDSTLYKQRIKDLEQLLAEKERTIQILMGKNNVK